MTKLAFFSRTVGVTSSVIFIFIIIMLNTTPFSLTRYYFSGTNGLSNPGPSNRVRLENGINKQQDDLAYFTSKMPFSFDYAKLKVKFKNSGQAQKIFLGYKDQRLWHYNTQILDDPILDNLNLQKIGSGPYLYQKVATYKSTNDFFNKPPENKVVGVADYKNFDILQPGILLNKYTPSKTNTTINVPLRGRTVMYVYLNHEPFNMSFTKRDINWTVDPDVAKISVYKGQEKVFDATVDDDGNATSNHKIGQPESIDIKNPGPGLPESGVYRVVIEAPVDSIITNITTNLHKIAFEGPLYLADNHEVYGDIVAKTKATTLVTNAQQLSFRSDHGQSKTATIDKQVVIVNKPNQVFKAINTAVSANISIPNSDMVVNGSGYFSFYTDQFFAPTPYKILPISSADDIAQVDYILTDYKVPRHEGEWLVAEREFNISDAFVQKGQLSWALEAPGLKENNQILEYKLVQIKLSKQGWLKK
jgi:hypothetical protein